MENKADIINTLKQQVLAMQGHRRATGDVSQVNLGSILNAFPDKVFPTGAVHEFISQETEAAAASIGFIAGLASQLIRKDGIAFWIGPKRTIFPPALKVFGIKPQRLVFVELPKPKECLWAIEEILKCKAVSAVIGEVKDLSFADSRRLQLAVENSHVTGFIHRFKPRNENPVACVTRWKVAPLPSAEVDIPGVGIPRWQIDLTKVRNGRPGSWQIEWIEKTFHEITQPGHIIPQHYHFNTA